MPEDPETKKAPEEKGPAKNFWPFIIVFILVCALAYTWIAKDNAEKTLDSAKEIHPALFEKIEANKAKLDQPQPAQEQAAPVTPQKETAVPAMTAPPATQPLAVQSQPAATPQTVTRDEFLKALKIIANDNEHLEAKIDACCQAKGKAPAKTVTHKKRRTANQPAKSYLPAGPSFSPQQQGDCQVPPGTDYPDRFMPAGPGCSGKTCTQYRQQ